MDMRGRLELPVKFLNIGADRTVAYIKYTGKDLGHHALVLFDIKENLANLRIDHAPHLLAFSRQ